MILQEGEGLASLSFLYLKIYIDMEDTNMIRDEKILDLESKGCFDFFWKEANSDPDSLGFGLIRDRAPGNPNMASIASVGYGLAALVIGAERKWVSYEESHERALGTMKTFLYNAEHVNGFFYHFLYMDSAKRYSGCEVSVIDTAILICGVLTAGEYFGGEVYELAEKIYLRVDWDWYVDHDRNLYYMGHHPENGHFGEWDFYAEQFMMYFLGAASTTHPINPELFYIFKRHVNSYGDYPEFTHTRSGSLFTYQFSHAWYDLRNTLDRNGYDWWRNSVLATKTNRQFCIDNSDKFKTLGANSWGLTASDGPKGYTGAYGAPPSEDNNAGHYTDGTVPPCGAAGSIVFTPEEVIESFNYLYENFPKLWGEYGFKDAYNLDVTPEYYSPDVIGIDKGITLLMIENYRSGLIWNVFMRNKYARLGMEKCEIRSLEAVKAAEEAAANIK